MEGLLWKWTNYWSGKFRGHNTIHREAKAMKLCQNVQEGELKCGNLGQAPPHIAS